MGRLRGLGEDISPSLPAARNFLHYFLRTPLGVIAAFLEEGAMSRVDSTSPSERSDDCSAKTVYRVRPREATQF